LSHPVQIRKVSYPTTKGKVTKQTECSIKQQLVEYSKIVTRPIKDELQLKINIIV